MDIDIVELIRNPWVAMAICALFAGIAIFILNKKIKPKPVAKTKEIDQVDSLPTLTKLGEFITQELADGHHHKTIDLAMKAEKLNIPIKGNSYKAAIHRTLFGLRFKGLVKMVESGIWVSNTGAPEDYQILKESCLVVDHKTRSFDVEEISITELEKVKFENFDGIGRQWFYEGKEVYYLYRNVHGLLSPILPPQTLESPPSLLYEAIIQEDTEIIFDVRKDESAFSKYGPYIAVMVIAAFVIIATMQNGG